MVKQLQEDHIPLNNYELIVVGLPPITWTGVDGPEEELETVDLPDRSPASGGNKKPVEFVVKVPLHHELEILAMNLWFQEGQDPVSPVYKKVGVLVYKSISGQRKKKVNLINLFISRRKWPDVEMENEGEMAVCEYTLKGNVAPLS